MIYYASRAPVTSHQNYPFWEIVRKTFKIYQFKYNIFICSPKIMFLGLFESYYLGLSAPKFVDQNTSLNQSSHILNCDGP